MKSPRKPLKMIKDEVDYFDHQTKGVRQMCRMTAGILADDMGLGKSLQMLTVAAVAYEMNELERILVVCPMSLKGNWGEEIEKQTKYSYTILDGSPKKRMKILEAFDAQILIVNYEQVVAHIDVLNSMGFDFCIIDEAHNIKGHKAIRTKAIHKLRIPRRWPITGSPILNQVDDLWSLLHIVDPLRFDNYYRFVNRYAVFGGYKNKQIVGVKNDAELREIVAQYIIRRTKKECLDLPGKRIIPVLIDMSPEQRKLYQQAKEEMKIDVPNADPLAIQNAMTKLLRLKQVCGTTAAIEGHEDHSAKLDKAVDMCVELIAQGEPVVVFTQFRKVLECFINRLEVAGVPYVQLHGDVPSKDRQPIVRSWTDAAAANQPMVLAATIQVAGVGLNMTAAHTMIRLDKLYVPGLNVQGEDRLDRIGQTQLVTIYDMEVRNSVEQRINRINENKEKIFGTVIGGSDTDYKRRLLQYVLADDEEEDQAA